jgi:hypothetical protein
MLCVQVLIVVYTTCKSHDLHLYFQIFYTYTCIERNCDVIEKLISLDGIPQR